jgi:hypothetical protein
LQCIFLVTTTWQRFWPQCTWGYYSSNAAAENHEWKEKKTFLFLADTQEKKFPILSVPLAVLSFFFCRQLQYMHRKKTFFLHFLTLHLVVRVASIVAHHDELLTQWSYIQMSKLGNNIFLISTTSNYLRSSAVCKNRSSKSWLFWFSRWNIWKICVN